MAYLRRHFSNFGTKLIRKNFYESKSYSNIMVAGFLIRGGSTVPKSPVIPAGHTFSILIRQNPALSLPRELNLNH